MFIARISRGRTIREFVIGILAVPTLFSALWFSVFSGSGIYFNHLQNAQLIDVVKIERNEIALFALLEQLPFPSFFIVCCYFINYFFFHYIRRLGNSCIRNAIK